VLHEEGCVCVWFDDLLDVLFFCICISICIRPFWTVGLGKTDMIYMTVHGYLLGYDI
jgi:hypothetical protein